MTLPCCENSLGQPGTIETSTIDDASASARAASCSTVVVLLRPRRATTVERRAFAAAVVGSLSDGSDVVAANEVDVDALSAASSDCAISTISSISKSALAGGATTVVDDEALVLLNCDGDGGDVVVAVVLLLLDDEAAVAIRVAALDVIDGALAAPLGVVVGVVVADFESRLLAIIVAPTSDGGVGRNGASSSFNEPTSAKICRNI